MPSDKKITIVALIALDEEQAIFNEVFKVKSDHCEPDRMCFEHEVEVKNVRLISVLAQGMGASNARSSAAHAIAKFNPDMLVVIGIAGGLSNDFKIGDVCVSNEIICVLNNAKFDEAGVRFSPDSYPVMIELSTSFNFIKLHPDFAATYEQWQKDAAQLVDDLKLKEFCRELPSIGVGPIVCGAVSGSEPYNEKIKQIDRKALAIETESGGVFQELQQSNIPTIAIRGISDLADSKKNELEEETGGNARRLSMKNACRLLEIQLTNPHFTNVAKKFANSQIDQNQEDLFPEDEFECNPVQELEIEIKSALVELCPEFKSKTDEVCLPVPRVTAMKYTEDSDGNSFETPEEVCSALEEADTLLIKMARSYPNKALSWNFAQHLLGKEIGGKILLPFVLKGEDVKPPKSGLFKNISSEMLGAVDKEHFTPVFLVEEPEFNSRSKIRFLTEEIGKLNGKVVILSKSEDYTSVVDQFVLDVEATEYQLTPISFSETAQFLENAFDMSPREAERFAIKLEDTFRKFQLDAHPTYFASLQEDTLDALINANKRAELIQLAVQSLLSLIVAADKAEPRLGRTTRENFLKMVVLSKCENEKFNDSDLNLLAASFLEDRIFDVSQAEFLNPFFKAGLLFQSDGKIFFTHPYLESYLLASALIENPDIAKSYFDPSRKNFDYYAFDLYCEMGPDSEVISNLEKYINVVLDAASETYKEDHVYLQKDKPLTSVSSVDQVKSYTSRLVTSAEKMDNDHANDDVRAEKQRILDTRRQVRAKMSKKAITKKDDLPQEIKVEFDILDGLSRSLALSVISIGSGAESLPGASKINLANQVLMVADKFTDIWTRNRLRIDFDKTREEMLSDEKIWEFMEYIGAEDDSYDAVKKDLSLFLSETELQMVLEPFRRVAWRISSNASAQVLSPVIKGAGSNSIVQRLVQGCWFLDVDPEAGSSFLKSALKDYKGNSILRLALANHFLDRLYWHHFKSVGANDFIKSARRALSPLGLKPSSKKIEQAKKRAR